MTLSMLHALEVKTSPLHGKGLFVSRTIHPPAAILILEPETDHLTKPYLMHVNHSCNPTCEMRLNTIVPKLPLIPGDEITIDFTVACDTCQPFICNCGAKNCHGLIEVKFSPSKTAVRFQERKVFMLGSDGEAVNDSHLTKLIKEW